MESLLPEKNAFFLELEQFAKEHRVPIMEPTGIETMLQIMKIQAPKRILEIGTAIGYSALRMVDAIPGSIVVTMELDEERVGQAQNNIKQFGMENRVTVLHGNALDLYKEAAENGPYDAIFIDAAKGQYVKFFELYERLLSNKGCIYSDNVLFKGLVAMDNSEENKRRASVAEKLKVYNQWLMDNKSFDTVIIPAGDGLAISRKRNGEK
nr:O-methyltransferase [Lederbergia citrea]